MVIWSYDIIGPRGSQFPSHGFLGSDGPPSVLLMGSWANHLYGHMIISSYGHMIIWSHDHRSSMIPLPFWLKLRFLFEAPNFFSSLRWSQLNWLRFALLPCSPAEAPVDTDGGYDEGRARLYGRAGGHEAVHLVLSCSTFRAS